MENNSLLATTDNTQNMQEKQAGARKGALVLQVVAILALAACAVGVTLINTGAL